MSVFYIISILFATITHSWRVRLFITWSLTQTVAPCLELFRNKPTLLILLILILIFFFAFFKNFKEKHISIWNTIRNYKKKAKKDFLYIDVVKFLNIYIGYALIRYIFRTVIYILILYNFDINNNFYNLYISGLLSMPFAFYFFNFILKKSLRKEKLNYKDFYIFNTYVIYNVNLYNICCWSIMSLIINKMGLLTIFIFMLCIFIFIKMVKKSMNERLLPTIILFLPHKAVSVVHLYTGEDPYFPISKESQVSIAQVLSGVPNNHHDTLVPESFFNGSNLENKNYYSHAKKFSITYTENDKESNLNLKIPNEHIRMIKNSKILDRVYNIEKKMVYIFNNNGNPIILHKNVLTLNSPFTGVITSASEVKFPYREILIVTYHHPNYPNNKIVPTFYLEDKIGLTYEYLKENLGIRFSAPLTNLKCVIIFTPEMPMIRSVNSPLKPLVEVWRACPYYTDITYQYGNVHSYTKVTEPVIYEPSKIFWNKDNLYAGEKIRKELLGYDEGLSQEQLERKGDYALRGLIRKYIARIEKLGKENDKDWNIYKSYSCTDIIRTIREPLWASVTAKVGLSPQEFNKGKKNTDFIFCTHEEGYISKNIVENDYVSMENARKRVLNHPSIAVELKEDEKSLIKEFYVVTFNNLNMEFLHLNISKNQLRLYTIFSPESQPNSELAKKYGIPGQIYHILETEDEKIVRKVLNNTLIPSDRSYYFNNHSNKYNIEWS